MAGRPSPPFSGEKSRREGVGQGSRPRPVVRGGRRCGGCHFAAAARGEEGSASIFAGAAVPNMDSSDPVPVPTFESQDL
jgi:hypothetical protein